MNLLISKVGLLNAKNRLLVMKENLAAAIEETALLYNNAGDTWHDNPAWIQSSRTTNTLQNQIDELDAILGCTLLHIDDLPVEEGFVSLGSEVILTREGVEQTWIILGELESDPDENIMSANAPFASTIIGKKVGDIFEFRGKKIEIISSKRWSGLE
ncbi:MAG: GreA/GreB family elongation factor [Candidatus Berkelbacteria bacterium]